MPEVTPHMLECGVDALILAGYGGTESETNEFMQQAVAKVYLAMAAAATRARNSTPRETNYQTAHDDDPHHTTWPTK